MKLLLTNAALRKQNKKLRAEIEELRRQIHHTKFDINVLQEEFVLLENFKNKHKRVEQYIKMANEYALESLHITDDSLTIIPRKPA